MLVSNDANKRLIMFSNWGDASAMDKSFWPKIVGTLGVDEAAVVMAAYYPTGSGIAGVQICTKDDVIGWVNAQNLRKI